ncbi:hypothetical protein PAAG_01846 [Paracoccidioides lutzii Pb01]|uniref:Uncharacterized protein n=1 Tax=Paracoccidioides lutzii (strain ATCC MYA-826 / Pb01) TaxID=502779 RepID=C1GTK1_PARBA|nr:hypothetical protein PAAG_01846 [Paracoccidioides lutzii Pb01]EEH39657.2 hypothetical protein PAAG_01846 [Paracoccidioides lutzii Pb01]
MPRGREQERGGAKNEEIMDAERSALLARMGQEDGGQTRRRTERIGREDGDRTKEKERKGSHSAGLSMRIGESEVWRKRNGVR